MFKELDRRQNHLNTTQICIVFLVFFVMVGCGVITVHHVPTPKSISSDRIPDFHESKSFDIKNGQNNSEEIEIGTVGVGKVVGNLQQWTGAAVSSVKDQMSKKGATIVNGAPKYLTLKITKAEVHSIPIIGTSKSTIILKVTTGDNSITDFEGSASSLAPLKAINGATTNAIKKLLEDPTINTYLRH